MSSFAWGSTALNVIRETYNPPVSEVALDEIALLPDPAALSTVATVIQQGGTKRNRVTFSAFTYTYSEYQAFLADMIAGTQRTFTGADSYSATMMITGLGAATRKIYPTRFEFSVTFMEV